MKLHSIFYVAVVFAFSLLFLDHASWNYTVYCCYFWIFTFFGSHFMKTVYDVVVYITFILTKVLNSMSFNIFCRESGIYQKQSFCSIFEIEVRFVFSSLFSNHTLWNCTVYYCCCWVLTLFVYVFSTSISFISFDMGKDKSTRDRISTLLLRLI